MAYDAMFTYHMVRIIRFYTQAFSKCMSVWTAGLISDQTRDSPFLDALNREGAGAAGTRSNPL